MPAQNLADFAKYVRSWVTDSDIGKASSFFAIDRARVTYVDGTDVTFVCTFVGASLTATNGSGQLLKLVFKNESTDLTYVAVRGSDKILVDARRMVFQQTHAKSLTMEF